MSVNLIFGSKSTKSISNRFCNVFIGDTYEYNMGYRYCVGDLNTRNSIVLCDMVFQNAEISYKSFASKKVFSFLILHNSCIPGKFSVW